MSYISKATAAMSECIDSILASDIDGDQKALELAESLKQFEAYLKKNVGDGDVVATPPDKTSAEAAENFQGGGYVDHLADKVANMLIETKRFPDRASAISFLMHNRDGVALLRRMSLHKKESTMDTVEKLEAARAANLRKIGNAVTIAKSIIEKETNLGLSQDDFVTIISNYDRKPGETEAQCFTRNYEANIELRKAMQVLKALPPLLSFEPLVADGVASFHEAVDNTTQSEAYEQLTRMAEQMRARVGGEMTPAAAFEKTLMDPANVALARAALNPPKPMTYLEFPRESSPK
jgi:hypothetical protein